MIHFIKTPAYETQPQNRDVFEYLNLVGQQIVDPPPLKPLGFFIDTDVVLYSRARRVKDGLSFNPKAKKLEISLLNEIPFEIKKLTSKKAWLEKKSSAVRAGFKKAFIEDQLPVSREQIFSEIKSVLNLCLLESPKTTISLVSHSFRLKIIEAFIKTDGLIEQNPELICKFIKNQEKTYEFEKGFSVSHETLSGLISLRCVCPKTKKNAKLFSLCPNS